MHLNFYVEFIDGLNLGIKSLNVPGVKDTL